MFEQKRYKDDNGTVVRTSPSKRVALAVTLPCYNDAAFLPNAIEALEKATPPLERDFVLVIAEDGSDSSSLVEKFASRYRNIVYFHNREKLGRGRALMNVWKQVNADIYLFMDVDMSTDLSRMNAYSNLVELVREGQFDLVTGSRYHPDSMTYRPIIRWFASIVYNKMLKLLFASKVGDHQCGFKAFSADFIREMTDVVTSSSWFWDTEVIIIAQRKGFRVAEIPVLWIEMKGPRTPIGRLLKDIWLHGIGILRLMLRVWLTGL